MYDTRPFDRTALKEYPVSIYGTPVQADDVRTITDSKFTGQPKEIENGSAPGLAYQTLNPYISIETRQLLFKFIENILNERWFDPLKINAYLGVNGTYSN